MEPILRWWEGKSWEERRLALLRIGVGVAFLITLLLIILSSIFPGWYGWGGKVENPPISPAPTARHLILGEKGGEE